MSLAAVLAVIYGVKQIAQDGVDGLSVLAIGAGLAVGLGFVGRQLRLGDPLLDLRLFANRAFSSSLVTYTLTVFVFFGSFLFVAQYLQLVVGLTPLEAGLWTVPGAVAFIAGSNLAPPIARRFPLAMVVSAGLALIALGFGLLSQVGLASLGLVVAAWVVMSIGAGLAFTLILEVIMGNAPPERAGAASALSESGAELGGALGLAILGSIGLAIYRNGVTVPAGVPPEAAATARDTLGGATAVAAQLPGPLGAALRETAHVAFVQGLNLAALIGFVVVIGLTILMAVQLRHMPASAPSETDLEPEPECVAV
jgi:DHA2 family multidrug resistance protein-like MFS transporter